MKTEEIKLTQLDRLRQAVITERENTESLKRFQEREDLKKRKRQKQTREPGPTVRFSSVGVRTADGQRETRNYLHFSHVESVPNFFTNRPRDSMIAPLDKIQTNNELAGHGPLS